MAKRWTREEDHVLLEGAGAFGLAWFRRRIGPSYAFPGAPPRSPDAIYARARKLWGKGGMTRGSYSMRQIAEESGYTRMQLRRAQKALQHSYRRTSPNSRMLVTDDQRLDLFAWLASDFWCKPLHRYGCVWCGTRERPHKGGGLCSRCYYAFRRATVRRAMPQSLESLCRLAEARRTPVQRRAYERLVRGVVPDRDVFDAFAQEVGK
jgi:hypothetical protein